MTQSIKSETVERFDMTRELQSCIVSTLHHEFQSLTAKLLLKLAERDEESRADIEEKWTHFRRDFFRELKHSGEQTHLPHVQALELVPIVPDVPVLKETPPPWAPDTQHPRARWLQPPAVPHPAAVQHPPDALHPPPSNRFTRFSVVSVFQPRGSFGAASTKSSRIQRHGFKRATVAGTKAGRLESQIFQAQMRMTMENLDEQVTWMDSFQKFIKCETFEFIMTLIFVLYAVVIGVQVDLESQTSAYSSTFAQVNAAFCAVFVLELAARLISYKTEYFTSTDRVWNVFDFFLVILIVLDLVLSYFQEPYSNRLAILKVLRCCRVLRLLRLVRLTTALKQMVYLILGSVSYFFWSLMIFFLQMYCFALFFTNQCTTTINSGKIDDDAALLAQSYWGTLGQSFVTLFSATTGGINWADSLNSFGTDFVLNHIVFFVYIAFTTFVMMNLVTGVFVDGAQRIFKEDKENDLITTAARAFATVDSDNDGIVTMEDFESNAEELHWIAFLDTVGVTVDEVGDLFRVLDKDKLGEISVGEFVQGCLLLNGPARFLDVATMSLCIRFLAEDLQTIIKKLDSL